MENISQGGGAPAADAVVEMVQPRSSVTIPLELFTVIAGFVPGKLAGVSRGLTVIDPNAKLDMLKKVKDLNVFSYLQGRLLPKINAQNLNFDFIRFINRLFKRVCIDVASLDSIRSNREITIQDVYGVLQGTNTDQIIREGKDRALQRFAEVLREGEHALAIPANLTPQQIRAWFADEANQEVLGHVTRLNLAGLGLRHLPDEIGRFRNLQHLNLSNNPLSSVPDSIRNWFLAAVGQIGNALQFAADALRADREVVLAAVRQNGQALEYAAPAFRADRDVVLTAVRQDELSLIHGSALQYAADALKADREVVLAAVRQHGDALEYAAEELRADREVVLAAVSQNGSALKFAAAALKADREVVLAAVSRDGSALNFAAAALKADREVVLAAVSRNGSALNFAAPALKADREVVLAAVTQNGWALWYAADELKADKEVVLAAVEQFGEALKFAADELKADREVVLAAVEQFGSALKFAAAALKADREVVLAAVTQNGWALQLADPALQADPEIRAAAGVMDV